MSFLVRIRVRKDPDSYDEEYRPKEALTSALADLFEDDPWRVEALNWLKANVTEIGDAFEEI